MKDVYKKDIKINAFDDFELDRSMNSDKFKNITGYNPPSWPKLVENMHHHVIVIKINFLENKICQKRF
uniref:hypothetical protein n=1 Tax=Aliarcobacter sp. TaxID=2321116 RepID=UPI00404884CA